jgi:hypothetical protein
MKMIRRTFVELEIVLPVTATKKMIREGKRALRDRMNQDRPVSSNRRYTWSKIKSCIEGTSLLLYANRLRLYVETNV